DDYFRAVYPASDTKDSSIGISGLMNDAQFNLVPEGLGRVKRRKTYESDSAHESLKDKREKRDELKDKKFKAQLKKDGKSDDAPSS
ncbi:lysine 2,3-aminomutase, partial [Bacillus licheniformis]